MVASNLVVEMALFSSAASPLSTNFTGNETQATDVFKRPSAPAHKRKLAVLKADSADENRSPKPPQPSMSGLRARTESNLFAFSASSALSDPKSPSAKQMSKKQRLSTEQPSLAEPRSPIPNFPLSHSFNSETTQLAHAFATKLKLGEVDQDLDIKPHPIPLTRSAAVPIKTSLVARKRFQVEEQEKVCPSSLKV